jgi:hypothetical protein
VRRSLYVTTDGWSITSSATSNGRDGGRTGPGLSASRGAESPNLSTYDAPPTLSLNTRLPRASNARSSLAEPPCQAPLSR